MMRDVEPLLGENDLTNVAFSIIERFTTQKSLHLVLVDLFDMVGASIKLWTGADQVSHVFVNPNLGTSGQTHRLICASKQGSASSFTSSIYEEMQVRPDVPVCSPKAPATSKPRRFSLPENQSEAIVQVTLSADHLQSHENVWIHQFDMANGAPLGHFSVAWFDREPQITTNDLNIIQNTLWNLARVLRGLLCNHYTVHPNTYFPSFLIEGPKTAAILFADIRNSTPLFEVARLGGDSQMRRVEILLRSWFQYSANLITGPGLGNLHRFTGDGVVATFGEYVIDITDLEKEETSCILALHAARLLADSFDKLYTRWRANPGVARFHRDVNEEIDLRLGVGINCGRIRFGYVGSSARVGCGINNPSQTWSSHLEYVAFGDHMNTTARIANVAANLSREVDLMERGARFKDQYKITPIVSSHAAAERLHRVLNVKNMYDRKGMVRLKGKGHCLSFYEIALEDVDPLRCGAILADVAAGQYTKVIKNPPPIEDCLQLLDSELATVPSDP